MDSSKRKNFFIILILGALSTVTPFSIDMYLPAFQQIAQDMGSSTSRIAFSLSSYFIGLSIGQLIYGPLLDRFGRKKPLYLGLVIFIAASIGCLRSHSVESLIIFRFLQAMGGCVAQVASMAMVRDFFHVKDSAKVFSLLMLILGVSPLFAPTVGSFITVHYGWHAVFIILSVIVAIILAVVFFFLPEGHVPDKTVSLKAKDIAAEFISILKEPQFYTYAFSGAFLFSGVLVYVAGSPIIFMDVFKVTPQLYGGIFALLSVGFIGGNQVNIFLSRKFKMHDIFKYASIVQSIVGVVFIAGVLAGVLNLVSTIILLFFILSCTGLTYPNAAALALAPFTKNAGSASALLGFLQIGVSSLASTGIGLMNSSTLLPIISILAGTTWVGLIILLIGRKKITRNFEAEENNIIVHP